MRKNRKISFEHIVFEVLMRHPSGDGKYSVGREVRREVWEEEEPGTECVSDRTRKLVRN